jgi:hypothetical protein
VDKLAMSSELNEDGSSTSSSSIFKISQVVVLDWRKLSLDDHAEHGFGTDFIEPHDAAYGNALIGFDEGGFSGEGRLYDIPGVCWSDLR